MSNTDTITQTSCTCCGEETVVVFAQTRSLSLDPDTGERFVTVARETLCEDCAEALEDTAATPDAFGEVIIETWRAL